MAFTRKGSDGHFSCQDSWQGKDWMRREGAECPKGATLVAISLLMRSSPVVGSGALGGKSPVDAQTGPGHEGGLGAGQIGHQRGDLLAAKKLEVVLGLDYGNGEAGAWGLQKKALANAPRLGTRDRRVKRTRPWLGGRRTPVPLGSPGQCTSGNAGR